MDTTRVEAWGQHVRAEWEALAVSTGAPPFLRPGWVEPVREHLLPRSSPSLVCVRRAGALVGVVPVHTERGDLRGLGTWQTPLSGPVVADAAALEQLVAGLLELAPRHVRLEFVDGDGPVLPALEVAAARAGRPLLRRTLRRSPWVDVDQDWETWQGRLRPGRAKQFRRQWRLLGREGDLRFTFAAPQEQLETQLAEALAVEASGWKGDFGSALLNRPRECAAFLDTARWAEQQGMLRLAFLRLDGRPIAVEVLLEQGSSLWSLKVGYDPGYASLSPGTLLALRVLEHACAAPALRCVELLGDDEQHKSRFADGARVVGSTEVWARGPRGLAGRSVRRTGLAVRSRVRRSVSPITWQRLSAARARFGGQVGDARPLLRVERRRQPR